MSHASYTSHACMLLHMITYSSDASSYAHICFTCLQVPNSLTIAKILWVVIYLKLHSEATSLLIDDVLSLWLGDNTLLNSFRICPSFDFFFFYRKRLRFILKMNNMVKYGWYNILVAVVFKNCRMTGPFRAIFYICFN